MRPACSGRTGSRRGRQWRNPWTWPPRAGVSRSRRRKTPPPGRSPGTPGGRGAAPRRAPLSKWLRSKMPACSNCVSTRYTVARPTSEFSCNSTRYTSSAVMWRCAPRWNTSRIFSRGRVALSPVFLSSSMVVMVSARAATPGMAKGPGKGPAATMVRSYRPAYTHA
jgi:hypothetical protein